MICCSRVRIFTKLSRAWAFGLLLLCGIFSVEMANAAEPSNSATDDSIIRSNQILTELNLLNEQLSFLESEHGPYHQALVVPIQGLTNLQIELENYPEAERLLDRQLQILRSVNGPTNLTQLSAITERIKNDIRQEDWPSVIDNYKFIQWLYSKRPEAPISERLESLSNLASWHMAAIYLDHQNYRSDHLVAYGKLLDQALGLAEEEFGTASEQTIPWMYKKALELHYRFDFSTTGDELSSQYFLTIDISKDYSAFRHVALSLVENIKDIVGKNGNLEAQAMALVYEADFIKIRGGVEISSRLYRQAKRKFLEAGIAEERIDAFYSQPTVLPMAEFHFSIDAAMAEQAPFEQRIDRDETTSEIFSVIDFVAMNESIPATRRPGIPGLLAGKSVELNSVLLQLQVGADGYVDTAKVVGTSPDEAKVRVYAINAMGGLTFRTNPINRWWSAKQTVTLLYMYPDKVNDIGI